MTDVLLGDPGMDGMDIVARADHLYNVIWKCLRDVEGWEYTFLKGERYHIPYGQPVDQGRYIGHQMDIDSFLRATQDIDSSFYTQSSYWEQTHTRSTFYAMDCSAFVSYCWGVPRTTTLNRHKLDCTCQWSVSLPGSLDALQPGDALDHAADHIVLVTAVYDDGTIEIMHETVPQLTKETMSRSEVMSRYAEYTI